MFFFCRFFLLARRVFLLCVLIVPRPGGPGFVQSCMTPETELIFWEAERRRRYAGRI